MLLQMTRDDITEILSADITLLELNIVVLMHKEKKLQIIDVISIVRQTNPGYKFIPDSNYYKAIANLVKKKYLEYKNG